MMAILGLLVGVALIAAGAYYWFKEKTDKESVKVYQTFIVIGAVITLAVTIKLVATGL